jgi:hypothetical protein
VLQTGFAFELVPLEEPGKLPGAHVQ